MNHFRKNSLLTIGCALTAVLSLSFWQITSAQSKPLTYPEIITALNTKLPNKSFKTKTELINWLINQIDQRKLDKPLTQDREDDLRQAGATNELLETIRQNSPTPLTPVTKTTPTATPTTLNGGNFQKGKAYFDQGKYDSAIAEFTQAIAAKQADAEVYYYRGQAYHYNGDTERAFEDYRTYRKLNPAASGAVLKCLQYESASGLHDAAIKDCTEAIGAQPSLALLYFKRGAAYNRTNQTDLALADFAKALSINPKFAPVYNNRAIVYNNQGDYDSAIADYTKAISINPNYAAAYFNRGNAASNKGDHASAIADYTKAISLDPNYVSAYVNRGYSYNEKGEYENALADLNKALSLNPKHAIAYNARGILYHKQRDYDRALDDYTKAIANNPNYADAYSNRGRIYFNKGDYDKAIADFRKALEIDPKDRETEVYLNRALKEKEKN